MICTECGKETPDDSAFCEQCGHAIASAENPVAASSADSAKDTAAFGDLDDAKPTEAASDLEPEASSADLESSNITGAHSPNTDSDSESPAIGLESAARNGFHSHAAEDDLEPHAAEIDSYHLDPLANDDSKFAPIDLYSRLKNLNVSTMARPGAEDEYVYPASVPLQPRLGRVRTVTIAVVGTLFGAALILLFCIAVMRLLGL